MLQLNDFPAGFQPDQKIVKAGEYQAYVDAKAIIARAKAEARRIKREAKQEYQNQKQQGYQDGLIEGQMQMSEKMIDAVSKTVEYFSGLEEKVVEIVLKALKKILGEMDDREVVVKVVRNALAVARNQATITLRVCPEQSSHVRARLNEILGQDPAIAVPEVVPDSRLEQGGCILETELGVIDASVDVQLEAIRKSLVRSITLRA